MYFEPLISVKCCPKLHIKQLRNNLHLSVRSGWVGGGVTDEKGGPGKGGSGPPDPPLWTRLCNHVKFQLLTFVFSVQ